MPLPYRICVVCTGNICRSPIGEAVLRRLVAEAGLEGTVGVDSYGTDGWHVGEPADPRTVAALHRAGYHLDHRARQWRAHHLLSYDLVLAADRGHERRLRAMATDETQAAKVRLLRSFDPEAGNDLDVADPYYGGAAAFDRTVATVEAACRGLVTALPARLDQSGPVPYG